MSAKKTARDLALVRDAMGQGGIEEGLKLTKGLHVGDAGMPAGDGDLWLENSIRYSTALSAGATGVSQTLIATGAWQPIVYDTEVWDTDDIFDLVVSTSRFYINTPGVYQMHGFTTWANAANGIRELAIRVNGSQFLSAVLMSNQTIGVPFDISLTWLLQEGDYVELVAWQSLGVSIDIAGQHFVIVRVP